MCWTGPHGEIRVPVEADGPLPEAIEIELSAEREKTVRLDAGAGAVDVKVGEQPTWHRVPLGGPTYDVINNVGSRLVLGGYGGDRGFLEPDRGQYAASEEVFAWCGGAVLLSARYLREVGIFDDRYFMYYEDTDLAWRGRLAGWRYRYVPESVVRHEHAASSKEGSTMFTHFVERNRFLTLARNAPWSMLTEAVVRLPPRHRGHLRPRRRAPGRAPRASLARVRAAPPPRVRRVREAAARHAQDAPPPGRVGVGPRRDRRTVGGRAMRAAVFNAHWKTLGGGEQLAGGVAAALARTHDVELLVNEPFDAIIASERLGFDLMAFPQVTIEQGTRRFLEVSGHYDLVVNTSFANTFASRAPPQPVLRALPGARRQDLGPQPRRRGRSPRSTRSRSWIEREHGLWLREFPGNGSWTKGEATIDLVMPRGVTMPFGLSLSAKPWPAEPDPARARDGRRPRRSTTTWSRTGAGCRCARR